MFKGNKSFLKDQGNVLKLQVDVSPASLQQAVGLWVLCRLGSCQACRFVHNVVSSPMASGAVAVMVVTSPGGRSMALCIQN